MLRFAGLLSLLVLSMSLVAGDRIISHVTSATGGFVTDVIMENDSVESRSVTLTPYDVDGNPLGAVDVALEGRAVLNRSTADLFQGAVSHFIISGDDNVRVGVNYNFQSGNGSPAFVAESSEEASGYRLFPGNWENIFDGIAVVNMGETPTDIWIAQKDATNNVINAHKVATDLAPNAKALFVIGSPNDNVFTPVDGSFFEVSGDQLLSMTALRGTLIDAPLGLLWANDSRPTSRATSKRDDRGVWFIEDGSLYDVFEMMGYNMAVDRLGQLEINRRQGEGRLAELNEAFLDFDILRRVYKYSNEKLDQLFASLSEENRTIYQAYVDGLNRRIGQVNASVGTDDSLMPIEFGFLGIERVESWDHRAVMSLLNFIQRGFSMRTAGTEQLTNAALLLDLQEKYGAEQGAMMFNDIRWTSDPASSTVAPKDATAKAAPAGPTARLPIAKKGMTGLADAFRNFADMMHANDELLTRNGIRLKMGSFSYVITGDRSTTGNPILYGAPQTGFTAPMLMAEGSVESDALTVSGMVIPGLPVFIMGRTPHHAWSMQVGHASSWDYYVVEDDEVFIDRQETIKLADGTEQVYEIPYSQYGPVVEFEGFRWSFKYAHRDIEFDLVSGIVGMARAESMESFGEAVSQIAASQHVQYVDRDGNIAAWHSGITPVRPEGDYRVPQGLLADQPALEWDPAVRKPMEFVSNPEQGWLAGWNTKASPETVDYAATTSYGPFHRGVFLQGLFRDAGPDAIWSFEDMKQVAVQIGATGGFAAGGNPWAFFEASVRAAVAANPTAEREAAMAMYDDWDQYAVAGGPDQWISGGDIQDQTIFAEAVIPRIISKTFDDELGAPPRDFDFFYRVHAFLHAMDPEPGPLAPQYDWFSNLEDPTAPQTANDIIVAAIDEVLAELGDRPWGAGARGSIAFNNLLFGDVIPILGLTPTPNGNRASYTHCIEYGSEGPVRIETLLPLGQSGLVRGSALAPQPHPHFSSSNDDFSNFVLREFPLFKTQ